MNEIKLITLGDRVKLAIKMLNFNSQKEFCEKFDILPSTLSGIILGKSPTADTLEKISKSGVNTHWLITGDGEILIRKSEVENEIKLKIGEEKSSGDRSELILRIFEKFSRMDLERLRRWEKSIDEALKEEQKAQTEIEPKTSGTS